MDIPPINLLPPLRRSAVSEENEFRTIRQNIITLGVVFALAFVVLFGAKIFLQNKLKQEESTTAAVQQSALRSRGELLDQRIQDLNKELIAVQKIQKGYVKWTPILSQVFRTLPPGVTLTSLEVSRESRTLLLNGVSNSRTNLLAFQRALSGLSILSNINAPVSNLLERENIQFDINATIVFP